MCFIPNLTRAVVENLENQMGKPEVVSLDTSALHQGLVSIEPMPMAAGHSESVLTFARSFS